jgi:hypothetical protein
MGSTPLVMMIARAALRAVARLRIFPALVGELPPSRRRSARCLRQLGAISLMRGPWASPAGIVEAGWTRSCTCRCFAAIRCQRVCARQQSADDQRAVHAVRHALRHSNADVGQRANLQLGQPRDRTAFAGERCNGVHLGLPGSLGASQHTRRRALAHPRVIHRRTARRRGLCPVTLVNCLRGVCFLIFPVACWVPRLSTARSA